MIGKIKYYLRRARAEQKFVKTIDLLVKCNALTKSLIQRFYEKKAHQVLVAQNWGSGASEWVEFIWSAADGFFRPMQDREEITELVELISQRRPTSLLEIGTANGGSLFLFCRACNPAATIVSIDLPGGINGGGFPKWKTQLYKKFAGSEQTLNLLRANSHHLTTVENVKRIPPNETYEVIMIDADHSYEGAKKDFELYKNLIKKGGILILHDIIENRFDPSIEVNLLWNEIRSEYKTHEIVSPKNNGNMGIGVVYM